MYLKHIYGTSHNVWELQSRQIDELKSYIWGELIFYYKKVYSEILYYKFIEKSQKLFSENTFFRVL